MSTKKKITIAILVIYLIVALIYGFATGYSEILHKEQSLDTLKIKTMDKLKDSNEVLVNGAKRKKLSTAQRRQLFKDLPFLGVI